VADGRLKLSQSLAEWQGTRKNPSHTTSIVVADGADFIEGRNMFYFFSCYFFPAFCVFFVLFIPLLVAKTSAELRKLRILFFNVPLHGHMNPTLDLVAELAKQGHEVVSN
jgi:hypothetical protein